MKFDEMRVLLTGASGGIGRATAQALLQQGACVLGVGRSQKAKEPTPAACAVDWLQADLTEAVDVERVARVAQRWGVNVLIHAAGQPAFGPADELTAEQTLLVLQTNLWAPIALTQALLPHLGAQAAARVVFVGSTLGRIGLPGYSLYGASKSGLHGYAEALRRELLDSPIRVQLLAPRATQTGFNSDSAQQYAAHTGSHSDTAEYVSQQLLGLLESGAAERFLGWPEKLFARLNGACGPWLDWGFRRHRQVLQLPSIKGTLP